MLARWYRQALRLLERDQGATAVEYALMVGGVALIIIAAVFAFGVNVNGLFEDIAIETARWIAS